MLLIGKEALVSKFMLIMLIYCLWQTSVAGSRMALSNSLVTWICNTFLSVFPFRTIVSVSLGFYALELTNCENHTSNSIHLLSCLVLTWRSSLTANPAYLSSTVSFVSFDFSRLDRGWVLLYCCSACIAYQYLLSWQFKGGQSTTPGYSLAKMFL